MSFLMKICLPKPEDGLQFHMLLEGILYGSIYMPLLLGLIKNMMQIYQCRQLVAYSKSEVCEARGFWSC